MSAPEVLCDPGAVVLATALADGAACVQDDKDEHEADYHRVLEREDSRGNVIEVDIEDLPTFYTAIRLGPMTVLLALAFGMFGPINTEFLKLRVCEVALNISTNICAQINEAQYKTEGNLVVKTSAHYTLYISIIGSIPSVILSFFVGSWSDKFGRKLPMLFPFVGLFLASSYMSVISNFNLSPDYLLVPPIIGALGGGWTILVMAKFSYIGDYTTDKNRAMNIAVIDGILVLFANLGSLLGGYLFKNYGLQIPFYVVTGLYGANFIYVLIIIRDRIPREKGTTHGGCGQLLSTTHLRENLATLMRKRTGATRLHMHVLLFCMLLYSICAQGDSSVTQLFLEFQPFKWDVEFYTLFNCINGLVSSVFLVACMIVLRKFFGTPDTMLGFVAAFSSILYYFGYGIAKNNWIIYVATAAGFLRHMVVACIRSLLAGMVDKDEIGKIMSVIASLQAITPLFGSSIFTTMFAETSSFYSGLCFTVAAFLTLPVMAGFGYIDVVRRRDFYFERVPCKPVLF